MKKFLLFVLPIMASFICSCSNDEPKGESGDNDIANSPKLNSIYLVEEDMYIFSNPTYDKSGNILSYKGDIDEPFNLLYYSEQDNRTTYKYESNGISIRFTDTSNELYEYTLNRGLISSGSWADKGVSPTTFEYEYRNNALESMKETSDVDQYDVFKLEWNNGLPLTFNNYFFEQEYNGGYFNYLAERNDIRYSGRTDKTIIPVLVLSWMSENLFSTYHTGVDPFLLYQGYFGKVPTYLPLSLKTMEEDGEIINEVSVDYDYNNGLVSKITAFQESEYSTPRTITLKIDWK